MSPEHNLMTDESADRIRQLTQEALTKREWLPPMALELALTTEALLIDRQARCELMEATKRNGTR